MEKEIKKTEPKQIEKEPIITNFFEDGNHHTHNKESYEKMLQHQDNIDKSKTDKK